MRSDGNLDVFHKAEGYVFAGYEGIFIALWRETPTLEAAKCLAASLAAFGSRAGDGVIMFAVVSPGIELPDGPTRQAMARDMKRHEAFTRAMALVYEGDGFSAAAVRSVFVGLQMLSRQAIPTKVFARVDEAAAWAVLQRIGSPMSSGDLIGAVADARR